MIKRDKYLAIITFLLPAVVLYAVFFLFPMAQAFYISLFRWSGLSLNKQFVGLQNFKTLLTDDPVFWKALSHNFIFLVVSLVVIIPVALFIASALSRKIKGAQTYRAVYLFPNMISIVAVAVLWYFIYDPNFGMFNSFLKSIGMGKHTVAWLGDPKMALPAVIVTSIWYSMGFYIVLLLAAIQSVPRSFYEAASIDGATGFQQFRHVTIPLIWEVLKLSIIYLIINTLNVFGLVWVMTNGGPNNHTETLLTYLYRVAIDNSDYGKGTALGVIAFLLIFTISLICNKLMKREAIEY